MSNSFSTASGQAVSAARSILHPASAAAGGLATAADTPAGDQAPSFAALFRQLAARQLSGDEVAIALRVQADAAAATADPAAEASDALTALLPFLEGMGMLPSDGDTPDTITREDPAMQAAAPEDAALALAAPATAPAIPAAELPDDAAMAGQGGMIAEKSGKPALAAQAIDLESGRGNDFAAQHVAAIDASKEGAHAPGNTSASVHQVLAATSSHGTNSAAPLPLAHPVGTPAWGEEVGQRIVWMANRMESRAELILNPPQMGRVEVSLSISGDQASASFASANPAVRDALEAALPRLREALADAGIQLGQAQVGTGNPGQTASEGKNGDNPGFDGVDEPAAGGLLMAESGMSSPTGLKSGRGLVDVFA